MKKLSMRTYEIASTSGATAKRAARKVLVPFYYLLNTRKSGIRRELRFWDGYLRSKGGEYRENFVQRVDPDAPIRSYNKEVVDALPWDEIHILDVGSGPLTSIGRRHPTKTIHLTAADPLGAEYRALLETAGVTAPTPPEACPGERLVERFGKARFHYVNAQNSLDHSVDPFACIQQMIAVTKPGGCVTLFHKENEAQTQRWRGLHRWNFRRFNEDELELWGSFGQRRSITEETLGCPIHNERRANHLYTRIQIPPEGEAADS